MEKDKLTNILKIPSEAKSKGERIDEIINGLRIKGWLYQDIFYLEKIAPIKPNLIFSS